MSHRQNSGMDCLISICGSNRIGITLNQVQNSNTEKNRIKILISFGTRPEAIKMAPVIMCLKNQKDVFDTIVGVTAQHRQMLDQVLSLFNIHPDYDLNVMTKNQTLPDLTAKIIREVTKILEKEKPDVVCVQGDTTTTAIVALASYYLKIPVVHIEAGLRTNNRYHPFPEEMNRRITSVIATLHFAPTQTAKENLLKEGVPANTIHVTGNTVIDALQWVVGEQKDTSEQSKWIKDFTARYNIVFAEPMHTILVTGHRRESFGEGFRQICEALAQLAQGDSNIQIIYPVHLNPQVQQPVYSLLGNIKNIHLIPPQEYEAFVFLMTQSYIILTDSGGVQEEAPTFGKPVLVMRETTERPEGLIAGTTKLVGTSSALIVKEAMTLLHDPGEYERMAKAVNPYGDGHASERISMYVEQWFRTGATKDSPRNIAE